MSILTIIKKKELAKIEELSLRVKELEQSVDVLTNKCIEKDERVNLLSKYQTIIDLDVAKACAEKELLSLSNQANSLKEDIADLKKIGNFEYERLDNLIQSKRKELLELNDEILLEEYGLYTPIYSFANSEQYKERLVDVRNRQKDMIKNKQAAICSTNWSVDNSIVKGRAMTNQNIKQILRCFNDECDVLINNVKFCNVETYIEKIHKSKESLDKINSGNAVYISYKYEALKIEELQLAYEYAQKKFEEKEKQREIREQRREEEKLIKEIEEARKDLYKEKTHYENALQDVLNKIDLGSTEEQGYLNARKSEIENRLSEILKSIEDIDYREANKRAGYVYVISNIGSFGDGVYKIGMTRRLDPMDRINELGDASVPFKFDVHAMIFSDDAPTLEASLHRAFENKKVNMVNGRREFFRVTLDEIESVVKTYYDKAVDFVRNPEAEQYRETQRIIERNTQLLPNTNPKNS